MNTAYSTLLGAVLTTLLFASGATANGSPTGDAAGNAPGPDVMATWDGGALDAAGIEEHLAGVSVRRGDEDAHKLDGLVARYRKAAQSAAISRILLGNIEDREAELERLELTETVAQTRQSNLIRTWITERSLDTEIDDDAVQAEYERRADAFMTPKVVDLWSIYRRAEDGEDPAEAMKLLESLKERFENGETFGALAREYSHSETQQRDGLAGTYPMTKLPAKLAEAVEPMQEGEIKGPIKVRTVRSFCTWRTSGTDGDVSSRKSRISCVASLWPRPWKPRADR